MLAIEKFYLSGNEMIFLDNIPEIDRYLKAVSSEIHENGYKKIITQTALKWIGFCLTAIIVTGSINWQRFEKASAGKWRARALSWMLHHSKIPWEKLFQASLKVVLKSFNVTSGTLSFDDFDRHRSKSTSKIFGVHKTRNKKGGGFVSSQNVVIMVLVNEYITVPVGFAFYRPDPKRKEWRKNDTILMMAGVKKIDRPAEPEYDPIFPTKKKVAAKLLRRFKHYNSQIIVKAISADNAYLSRMMRSECSRIYPRVQFISQLKASQHVL